MLSYFCSNCGGKNIYQFVLGSIPASTNVKSNQFEVNISPNKSINRNIENRSEIFEQEEVQDYSSMKGLDVNIEKYGQDNGIKLGELVSDEPVKTKMTANKKANKSRRGRKKIARSLPDSFVSEAKMSGRNYQNYEDVNIIDNEE
jgi:hypothetical protein